MTLWAGGRGSTCAEAFEWPTLSTISGERVGLPFASLPVLMGLTLGLLSLQFSVSSSNSSF